MQFKRENIGPEWQDLVEEFPEIFLDPSEEVLDIYKEHYENEVITKSDLSNLRFGFECDIGWKSIIRDFCVSIRELVQRAKVNDHTVAYKTFILKEKFGSLRDQGDFYGPDSSLYRQEYNTISRIMEDSSTHICELTGAEGHLVSNDRGTYKTLCQEEAEKLKFNWK